ncbi:MAG TPA: phosphatase PAP2 family protein [Candidatus Saccharimonadales bacterium]|nr:phosphatase PAP2 family protein [Candidatus Saccharimonadales bacterium]
MAKLKRIHFIKAFGLIGALLCLAAFIHEPSFPTPDKLFVFLLFVFMAFDNAWEFTKRLLPFVVVILIYESFRSVADQLNKHVHYGFAPHADKLLFGNLPTVYLQNWLWTGHVRWYDILLYIPYMMFFIIPFFVAILVWKTRDSYYWQVITAYSLLFFAGYLTFLLLPTAPPWLASQNHYIQPITRVSSYVWSAMGIHNFPSVYNHISPNPVAAFPSLHAGVSTLFSLMIFKLYGRRWGALSLLYPTLIYIGVVYEGEHYAIDVIAGIVYAVGAYLTAPYVSRELEKLSCWLRLKYSSSTRSVSKSAR